MSCKAVGLGDGAKVPQGWQVLDLKQWGKVNYKAKIGVWDEWAKLCRRSAYMEVEMRAGAWS